MLDKLTIAHQRRYSVLDVKAAKKGDVVLDPFAGIGTVGKAASKLGRRFVLLEQNPEYVRFIREDAKLWLGKEAKLIHAINCPQIDVENILF